MGKRKLGENHVKLPRKIRAVSGYNVYHAECMRSAESLSCTTLQEKNCFSATKWRSLSAEEKGEYNNKAAGMHSTSAEDSVIINVKQEISKLLKRLQDMIEYADALPGFDMFFVSVHKGNHVVGGTKEGCNFMQKEGYFIPSLFMGYLSSHSAVTISATPSPSEDDDSNTSDVENDKDSLRKAVQGVFNNLYGLCVGNINVKLPYNKITEYGISIDNLPDDITLKHPSSYGKAILRKILAIKNQLQMTVTNRPMYTATMTTTTMTTMTATTTVVGQQPTGQRPTTTAVGQQSTTTAVGQQSTTTAVGQQPTMTAVGQQRRPPTTAVGQQPTTTAVGQQPPMTIVGQQSTGQQPTTTAVGQQRRPPTTAVGQQPTGQQPTTTAVGQQPPMTTVGQQHGLVVASDNCHNQQTVSKATTTVNLLFNGTVVANGIAVEGPMLHGKKIPSFFQKVAVTSVHKRTKLLFKTSFDDSDYVNVGEVIVWPSSLIQSL